jgi:metacaspase-1
MKQKIAFLVAINNYPGTINDLEGCLNDQKDMRRFLEKLGYTFLLLKDEQATVNNVKAELTKLISTLNEGDKLIFHYSGHGTQIKDKNGDEADGYDEALYLYDGALIDDDLGQILMNTPEGANVLCLFDSCFSGTVTREVNEEKRIKFVKTDEIRPHFRRSHKIVTEKDMKWAVISGCSENQTSADAIFHGRPNGAFTYFLLKSFKSGTTIKEWLNNIRTLLPNKDYDQVPTLEGAESIINQVLP